jgi:hypothetical protein
MPTAEAEHRTKYPKKKLNFMNYILKFMKYFLKPGNQEITTTVLVSKKEAEFH